MNDSNTLPTDSDVLCRYKQMVRDRALRAAEAGVRLGAVLSTLGVVSVVAEYDGCGDSGQIESIEFRKAGDQVCEDVPDETHKAVEEMLYDLLEVRHGGWENNDGAFGTFTWTLAENALDHEHNDRFTDYETTSYEGFGEVSEEGGQ